MVNENSHADKKILIVEDEYHIAEGIRLNLSLQGYQAEMALDGAQGLSRWEVWEPDLIILDVMLPVMDGLSVLKAVREKNEKLPVLILSAKGTPEDRVQGLSCGVDDYMVKPFVLEELLLRVERLLTRVHWARAEMEESPRDASGKRFRFGENEVDLETAEAVCAQGEIRLTDQELKLLSIFVENPGRPLPRKLLLEVGWGYSRFSSTRTVDNFIVRLRKYFEPEPKNPRYFKSIRSRGYLFDPGGDL